MVWVSRFAALWCCCALSVACQPGSSRPKERVLDDAGPGLIIDAGAQPPDDADVPQAEPHLLLSVTPGHGPFSGGTRVALRGNGFAGNARVWFGENEVSETDVVALDPHRLQVISPAGNAGSTDLIVQNGDDESTRVMLRGGFVYDSFYVDPPTGPTSGGTLITLKGQGTSWDETTRVSIDHQPCEVVELHSEAELVCRAPAGTQGAKPVRIETDGQDPFDLSDGYSYSDTDNGYRGGFSGEPLGTELRVLVFDSYLGEPIPGAAVILGAEEPKVARTDGSGQVVVGVDTSSGLPTVTITAKCFQPTTFVQVPSSTITAYLSPVLSVACADGELELGGGNPGRRASVNGELVWPETQEFRRDNWSNIPEPKSPSEVKVAYVFRLTPRATDRFSLPSAVGAVTPESDGTIGFSFYLSTAPGTQTLYALAGLENRAKSPAEFTAYAMGLVRGVVAPASEQVSDVYIPIDAPLDHTVTLDLLPPERTRKGPDRVQAAVAVRVGGEGYALLPQGHQQRLLGDNRQLSFVGVPSLSGSLTDTSYVTAVEASSEGGGLPRSGVALLQLPRGSDSVQVGPFLAIPSLSLPAPNAAWDFRQLKWDYGSAAIEPDLAVIEITSESGLYTWSIVAPAAARAADLPDLGAIAKDLAFPRGTQSILVSIGSIPSFRYAALRYRDLSNRNWAAYASDASTAIY